MNTLFEILHSILKTYVFKHYYSFTSLHFPSFFFFLLAGSDHPPPVIKQGPLNQTVPVDSTVVLGCQTAGSPPPTVHWKRDGAVLSPVDSRMSIADTGSLEIRYTKVRDEEIKQFTAATLSQGNTLISVLPLLSWEIQASTLVLLLVPMERLPGQHTCRWRVGFHKIR